MRQEISALIVDDHPLFRSAARELLESVESITRVEEACDGMECLEKLEHTSYSIVLLDISMPRMDGVACLKEIRRRWRMQKVAILTQYTQPVFFRKLIQMGADGYILKGEAPERIIEFIRTILFDDTKAISPELEDAVIDSGSLSPREVEVLRLMCQGVNSNEIAEALCISINTVNNHRTSLSNKIRSNNLATQVCWAINNGYHALN